MGSLASIARRLLPLLLVCVAFGSTAVREADGPVAGGPTGADAPAAERFAAAASLELVSAAVAPTDSLVAAGSVVVVAPPPSVFTSETESETEIRLFGEAAVVLDAPLRLDASLPGTYDDPTGLMPVTIPAGVRVASYLLHFDPELSGTVSGAVTFPRPVLGVIVERSSLDASDPALGHPDTAYPWPGSFWGDHRGLELAGFNQTLPDLLVLGADGRTVTLALQDWIFDQVRVVTAWSCGDGVLGPDEQCDDGNAVDGDCCSSLCRFEPPLASCDDGRGCTPASACDTAGTCVGVGCQAGAVCASGACSGLRYCAAPGDGRCACGAAGAVELPGCDALSLTPGDMDAAVVTAVAALRAQNLPVEPHQRAHWPLVLARVAQDLGCRLDAPAPAAASVSAATAAASGCGPPLANDPAGCMGDFDPELDYCGPGDEANGTPALLVVGANSCINAACWCHDACGRERCVGASCQFTGSVCDQDFLARCAACETADFRSGFVCAMARGASAWIPTLRCDAGNPTRCHAPDACCGCNCAGDSVCGDCARLEISGFAPDRPHARWGPAQPGSDPADVAISWEGFATFPITVDYTVSRCPGGWRCIDNAQSFGECSEPIRWPDGFGCWGGVPNLPEHLEGEYTLTDAQGQTSPPARLSILCE